MAHNNMPAELAQVIALHREMFAGVTMQAKASPAPEGVDSAAPEPPTAPAEPATNEGEQLGEPGLKALQSERESRKNAEKELVAARARLQPPRKAPERASQTRSSPST